jgi:hypothetical protein
MVSSRPPNTPRSMSRVTPMLVDRFPTNHRQGKGESIPLFWFCWAKRPWALGPLTGPVLAVVVKAAY